MASIMDKMRENKLNLFGYVMKLEGLEAIRIVMKIYIRAKRGRRLKRKRLDPIEGVI